jgi:hypothetical protein
VAVRRPQILHEEGQRIHRKRVTVRLADHLGQSLATVCNFFFLLQELHGFENLRWCQR